ncbi:MAG: hypothetical protein EBU90_23415 [Proteobacteria bacterium]|nr:hypothetical protein [Pseudomonadota bacterium]NBP16426.1 hypothetical protein [bacterium]
MNSAFARKFVSDELRESLLWCGLVDNYHCKTKKVEGGKTYYELETKIGKVYVYSPNSIKINNERVKSLTQAKQLLVKYLE